MDPQHGPRLRRPGVVGRARSRRSTPSGNRDSRARSTAHSVSLYGASSPSSRLSSTTWPLMTSISERRRARWSSRIDGLASGMVAEKSVT